MPVSHTCTATCTIHYQTMSQKQQHYRLQLDYCNSLFIDISVSNFKSLQRVQNTLARMVLWHGKFEHMTRALIDLHWLPVHYRVTYNLAALTYSIKRYGHLHIYMMTTNYKTTNQPILSTLLLMTCLQLLVLDLFHIVPLDILQLYFTCNSVPFNICNCDTEPKMIAVHCP